MNFKYLFFILCTFVFVSCGNKKADDTTKKIKVACIGNSITYGHGIDDRENNSYPAVLGKMLGDGYEVHNFGKSGRTLLNKGNRPYMKEKEYKEALKFEPDIVIIKLGTNDSKGKNIIYKVEFEKDLKSMVKSFERLKSKPEIYLCYPAKVYGLRTSIDEPDNVINDSIISNEIIPMIKNVAQKNNLKVIDLYTATSNMPENFPDLIHPNENGAEAIAKEVYKSITGKEFVNTDIKEEQALN